MITQAGRPSSSAHHPRRRSGTRSSRPSRAIARQAERSGLPVRDVSAAVQAPALLDAVRERCSYRRTGSSSHAARECPREASTSEAYVSPEIEAALGYSREEWLEDPVRWYQRIHPEDKQRWSLEAAEMFLSGKALRSSYRVIARDGHVVWFHCDARMVRRPDGQPWFIHGVAFDISDLKHTERALQQESNFVSRILDTVGALITVLDHDGRIVGFNRACELTTGYSFDEVRGKCIWDFFMLPEEVARSRTVIEQLSADLLPQDYQSHWVTRHGTNID